MNGNWSLTELYSDFNSVEFKADIELLNKKIENFKGFVDEITSNYDNLEDKLISYIKETNDFKNLSNKLLMYSNLVVSVDTKNTTGLKTLEIIEQNLAKIADSSAKLYKWIGSIENLNCVVANSSLLIEHEFHFNELKEISKYILSDKEELLIAQMKNSGSSAWTKLKDLETSSLLVDIAIDGEDKKLPLSVVRNMAFSDDVNVRKMPMKQN